MLTAMQYRTVSNTGAYGNHGGETLANGMSGPWAIYKCPNKKGDGYAVYTNLQCGGGFRGYGTTQPTFAIESALDELAALLKIDPIEMRRKNVIGPNDKMESALSEISDLTMGSYGLDQCIDAVEKALASGRGLSKPQGDDWLEGSGMALSMLDCVPPTEQRSGSEVALLPDGGYHFTVGSVEIGNGLVTAQQQIVAQVMGCPTALVSFVNADTDKTPYDSGTFASVGMMVPAKAVENAAVALREKILAFAARTSGTQVEQCRLDDDAVLCGDRRVSLPELYAAARAHGEQLACFRKAYGSPRTVAFIAYGVRLAVHRVTGEIHILFSIEAVDAGVVMNPNQLRGQVIGGVVQGIGYALQEKMVYNDAGAVINPTLRNYRIPTFADSPVTEVFCAEYVRRDRAARLKIDRRKHDQPGCPGDRQRAQGSDRRAVHCPAVQRGSNLLKTPAVISLEQPPENGDLERVAAQQHERHCEHERSRPALRKQPRPEKANRQRHQWPRCQQDADGVAGEGRERRRQPAQMGIEKLEFEHHDRKQREQDEARRFPHARRFAGGRIGGNPAWKRRVDALRVEALDQGRRFLDQRRALRRVLPRA